jgi:hypothetical protein
MPRGRHANKVVTNTMVCHMAEDVVEKISVYKVFASRSEVTDGRNCVKSSLYRTFFTST